MQQHIHRYVENIPVLPVSDQIIYQLIDFEAFDGPLKVLSDFMANNKPVDYSKTNTDYGYRYSEVCF